MKRLLLMGALAAGATLAWPSVARASLSDGLAKLAAGRRDCQQKRFAAGVKKLLDSALIIQTANPRHAANRQWLPAARRCLRAWVSHTSRQCAKQGRVASLKLLLAIRGRVKYLAAPGVKRLIAARLKPCARAIVKLRAKECVETPNQEAVARLDALKATLRGLGVDAQILGRLTRERSRCAFQWIKEAESRCQTNATVAALKGIGAGIVQVRGAQRVKARAAYETCAKALGTRGWQICKSHRYVKGRALLGAAIVRYGFYRARDKAFLRKMQRQWLPRCGTYLVKGYFHMRVKAGKVAYKLAARVRVEVTRTQRGNVLAGAMTVSYSGVNGLRAGCRVLITPTDGSYAVTGSENRAAGRLTVMLAGTVHQRAAKEEMQVTCGSDTPEQANTRYVHALLKAAGVFSIGLSTRSGAHRTYQWRGRLGRHATGSHTGSLKLTHLK
jgi:hypothetical protein